jgi:beta-phosphoglucomutase-like phosphatase (HAD superfamily)
LNGRPDAIILDFDGVIADSEVLANRVLAEMVTALGHPTSLDEALDRYMGKRLSELMAAIAADASQPLPETFAQDLQAKTLARFRSDLREVSGARAFLEAHAAVKRCIASSSSRERLAGKFLGSPTFSPGLFSARTRSPEASRIRTCSCWLPSA